jgi:hypothetical protein
MTRSKLIYLASPYSHPDHNVRESRFVEVTKIAAEIISRCPGVSVFGPITQSHSIAEYLPESTNNGDFWLPIDFAVLTRCDELWLADMDGLDDSVGVAEEIELALSLGIPIRSVPMGIETYRG